MWSCRFCRCRNPLPHVLQRSSFSSSAIAARVTGLERGRDELLPTGRSRGESVMRFQAVCLSPSPLEEVDFSGGTVGKLGEEEPVEHLRRFEVR